jgi:hypothetical protein
MNEDHLGGFSTTKNKVLGTYSIGGCWCGESYFVDPLDGVGRVVTSGGYTVQVYKIQLRVLCLGFLQAQIAVVSEGRLIRRNSSWKRGLSRRLSMLGSI